MAALAIRRSLSKSTLATGKVSNYEKIISVSCMVEELLTRTVALLHCHWKLNEQVSKVELSASTNCAQTSPCCTLDILFTPISILPPHRTSTPTPTAPEIHSAGSKVSGQVSKPDPIFGITPRDSHSKAQVFIDNALKKNIDQYGCSITAIKLLLPAVDGYVVRNDTIQRRFLSYDLAENVVDFTSLEQHVRAFESRGDDVFQRALRDALGAVLLKDLPGLHRPLVESAMSQLESDVIARLSFPWIIETPMPKKRLALVDGRPDPAVSAAAEGTYRAAAALGIELVIIDREGHWVQDPVNEHLRDEFLACDLNLDEGLPDRIVEAVSKSKGVIDGIMTYADRYLTATAKAASILGLWTNPPEALEICKDKRKTREVTTPELPILSTTGVLDLKEQLKRSDIAVQYPSIVKPVKGYCSEGVTKVTSEEALFAAVRMNQERFPRNSFVIEPYITGPEVDANFVLFDGKVLFSEINDDFPSSAEIPQHGEDTHKTSASSLSFAELSTIMPSILPDHELSLLKSSLSGTLLKLGFRNGVFHVEARIKDSRKSYEMNDQGMELTDHQIGTGRQPEPSVFLIEINARVPGYQEIFAVEYTYGIDYFALAMLMALTPTSSKNTQDLPQNGHDVDFNSRVHALGEPFPAHIQHPSNIVFVPVTRGGTFMSSKPLPQPLMNYVPYSEVLMKKDQVIEDPEVEGKGHLSRGSWSQQS